jgi:hypothetical protein
MAGVRFPAGERNVSLLHIVQTGYGALAASCLMGTGLKRPEREDDHSPPSSAEVKNGGTLLLLFHMSSWRSA